MPSSLWPISKAAIRTRFATATSGLCVRVWPMRRSSGRAIDANPWRRYREVLKGVTFQNKLGSDLRQERTSGGACCSHRSMPSDGDESAARRARGSSAKCDLLTAMVGEFPELQGLMGKYYAAHSGEPAEVCAAFEEQYLPRFSGDRLPQTRTRRRARAGRQTRHDRGHLRDRPEAERYARSLRAAARRAWRTAHRS